MPTIKTVFQRRGRRRAPFRLRSSVLFRGTWMVAVVALLGCARMFMGMERETTANPSSAVGIRGGDIATTIPCRLEPAWGFPGDEEESGCTGAAPQRPYTTARGLSCPSSSTTTTPPPRATKGVTIAILYYADPASLLRQMAHYAGMTMPLWDRLWIVDDGSPVGLRAEDVLTRKDHYDRIPGLGVARITEDLTWNQPGARNLAMHLAGGHSGEHDDDDEHEPLVLLLDSDLLVPASVLEDLGTSWKRTAEVVVGGDGAVAVVAHTFNRTRPVRHDEKTSLEYKQHPSALATMPSAWWSVGGMDEDFAGHYGSEDTAFWWRVGLWSPPPDERDSGACVPSSGGRRTCGVVAEHHPGAVLEQFEVDSPCDPAWLDRDAAERCQKAAAAAHPKPSRNTNLNQVKFRKKRTKGCWSNSYLRFPWHLVPVPPA